MFGGRYPEHMTRAPRQKTTLRRVLHWVAGGTVAAQMATMAGLVVFNGVRRRGRRPYRFPTAPVESLEVGDHRSRSSPSDVTSTLR